VGYSPDNVFYLFHRQLDELVVTDPFEASDLLVVLA